MVASIEDALDPVDILVNNAGIVSHQPLGEIAEEDWDHLLAVNLKSAFLLSQSVLPGMRAKGWGRIINLSSVAAQTGGITGPHYAASKAGLLGLTHSYARHLFKTGVTVNAIAPALVETDMVTADLKAEPRGDPRGTFWHARRSGRRGRTAGPKRLHHRPDHQRERRLVHELTSPHGGITGRSTVMSLPLRKLGRQGLEVSAIGLGCMGMSQSYGPADETESIATLHRAIALGCTFFDTAEVYGPFANEELLGRALSARREQVVLATKFGFRIENGQDGRHRQPPRAHPAGGRRLLRRLRTDHIDLLYQHRVDRNVPMEEVAGTVGDLVRAGKVRYFGLSEAGVDSIRRAHAVHPVSALQSEYSLWERNLERDILPVLRELGIGLVPFSPLGRGFLTGKVKRAEEYPAEDFRHNDPRYQGENYDANVHAAQKVHEIAQSLNVKPGQVALAWLLHKGQDIVPIPGTKRRIYLEENLAAANLALDASHMQALDEALAPRNIAGPRYNEKMMTLVDR